MAGGARAEASRAGLEAVASGVRDVYGGLRTGASGDWDVALRACVRYCDGGGGV
jgi:hypothetical protein